MKIVKISGLKSVPTSHAGVGQKRVIIKPGEVSHLTQYGQVTFKPGDVAQEHSHPDMFEIFTIDNGKGKIKVNGKSYNIDTGNCIIVYPNEKHEITNSGYVPLIISYFGISEA
jgi:quercetin dioxygenase-like cupin family protein